MSDSVPAEMDALIADRPATDPVAAVSHLRVERRGVPRPRRGQVLVRIHAAPCNPADLMYLEGRYGIDRPLPATPGFEGAGTVVASGGGLLARWLLGRRVACGGHSCSGTWAQYCVADATLCLPLSRALTFEQGAAALANPMTALALTRLLSRGRRAAYVQTGAAGQLGRMILVAAREQGLTGIHVVRRGAQVDSLKALGAAHVLVSTDERFDQALAERCRELRADIALDAVAGSMTGRLLNALPRGSEVVVYGALSGERCSDMDPMSFAFGDKRVRGFEIAAYLRELGLLRAFRLASAAQRRVGSGGFSTQIRERVLLADAPAVLTTYVGRMSDGKVLITP